MVRPSAPLHPSAPAIGVSCQGLKIGRWRREWQAGVYTYPAESLIDRSFRRNKYIWCVFGIFSRCSCCWASTFKKQLNILSKLTTKCPPIGTCKLVKIGFTTLISNWPYTIRNCPSLNTFSSQATLCQEVERHDSKCFLGPLWAVCRQPLTFQNWWPMPFTFQGPSKTSENGFPCIIHHFHHFLGNAAAVREFLISKRKLGKNHRWIMLPTGEMSIVSVDLWQVCLSLMAVTTFLCHL